MKKIVFLFFLILSLAFLPSVAPSLTVAAQSSSVVKSGDAVRDYKLNSSLMKREMPYRVALPPSYNANAGERYTVVYLLHGLTGHYDNWGDKTKIADYLVPFNVIVVMPEGANGWYTDSATVPDDKYESYVVRELIPEIDKKFRTLANRENRIIAGLSMGGYGSLKYGLKYPETFAIVGSFSGALGATSWTDKNLAVLNWKTLTDSVMSVYGAENSATRIDNDIFKLAREMPAERIKDLPFVYLDCGTEDSLISYNRDFATILLNKKIPHEFRQLPGAHNWQYWELQIQEFLRLVNRLTAKQKVKAA